MPLPGSHYSPGTTHSTPFPTSDPQLPFNDLDKCPGFQEISVSIVRMNSNRLSQNPPQPAAWPLYWHVVGADFYANGRVCKMNVCVLFYL